MRQIIIAILFITTLQSHAQRTSTKRGTVTISIDNFIGTWKLTKYADIHLDYKKGPVKSETLRFTKDSIIVNAENKRFAGTWKLVNSQLIISIKETNRFNYRWISGNIDSKFFTRKGLGYYKYFERISK
jgi:hypothetical protein